MKSFIEQAQQILKENDRGGYTIPSDKLYPFQWNWDSVFCALGFSFFDLPRAWQEIENLLGAQWPNGMVPHIVFHKDDPNYFPGPKVWGSPWGSSSGVSPSCPTSCYSQPPVLASVLRHLVEKDNYNKANDQARELYEKTLLWHGWWMKERRDEKTGMIYVVHPWESGRDNSIDFDGGMKGVRVAQQGSAIKNKRRDTNFVDNSQRPTEEDYKKFLTILENHKSKDWDYKEMRRGPFCVTDVGIFFILLRAHHDLLFLAEKWNDKAAQVKLRQWIKEMEASSVFYWNAKIKSFAAKNLLTDEFSEVISNSAFLFWYSKLSAKEEMSEKSKVMLENLKLISEQAEFLVPSADPRHGKFDPKRYWRGPVWAIMNFMIAKGLSKGLGERLSEGVSKKAEVTEEFFHKKIKGDTLGVIEKSAFYEYYSPVDGSPLGGQRFSWTAAIYLAMVLDEF